MCATLASESRKESLASESSAAGDSDDPSRTGGNSRVAARLAQSALRRLDADGPNVSALPAAHARRLDASNAFLQRWREGFLLRSAGCIDAGWRGGLHEWLQACSQEPDASFLSQGAASTAEMLGLKLVRWAGKPQGRYRGLRSWVGHASVVRCVAFSPDGTLIVSGSGDCLVKIWNAATGAEVRTDPGSRAGPCPIAYRRMPVPGLRTRTHSRLTAS